MVERSFFLVHDPENEDCPVAFNILPTSVLRTVRVMVTDAFSSTQTWDEYRKTRGIEHLECEGCGGTLDIPKLTELE